MINAVFLVGLSGLGLLRGFVLAAFLTAAEYGVWGILVVSHDRAFLKRTCTHTLELSRGQLEMFPGDVDAYLTNVDERREHTNPEHEGRERHSAGGGSRDSSLLASWNSIP